MFDAHIHSTFSDGNLHVDEIVKIARRKNFNIGIADHAGSTYPLCSHEAIFDYLKVLKKYPVKCSLELNINENFSLNDDILEDLDYCIGGVHFEGNTLVGISEITANHTQEFMDTIVEIMVDAMNKGRMNILSHLTCLPKCITHLSGELFTPIRCDKIISTAVKNNIYLEINNLFKVPNEEFVDRALRAGACFSVGSDGHLPGAVCNLDYPRQVIRNLNIPEERILKK